MAQTDSDGTAARRDAALAEARAEIAELKRRLEAAEQRLIDAAPASTVSLRRAEDAIRVGGLQQARVERMLQVGSWSLDMATQALSASEELLRILDLPREDATIDAFARVIHPEDLDNALRLLRIGAEQGKPYELEHRLRLRDGTVKWVHTHGEPSVDGAGKTLVLYGTTQDITARKRSEGALHELTGRLRLATASARAGVWDWDLQANTMVWDDRMLELYGHTRASFPGGIEAWQQGLYPEDSGRALAECEAALRGEREFDTEFRVRRPDESVVHVKANGLVLRDDKGKPLRMIGLNTDITERTRAEQERAKLEGQLHQALKMESVGRLAGGVAHDFNNMLGVILGNTEAALEQLDATSPLREDLQEVQKAAARSADLTRQLLAFARKQTVTPKVLDLNDAVARMLKLLERLIGEDVQVDWRPSEGLWPLKVDPSQIDQTLTNLCVNARDAISGVGRLTIETSNVTLDEGYCAAHEGAVPGEYVRLTVSDDGCGMDRETQARIFEPFFTTKGAGSGTGLGLATVYGIVKQNNGFIDVRSAVERGTTFTIYLPRHEETAGRAQADSVAVPPSRGHETILLVEDEASILRLTRRMLEQMGYTVLTASAPGDALRLAEGHSGEIQLLMTDVVMPEMNGRDLAKNLLSRYPGLRRLFMSGYTADVIASHGVLDEGVNFIQKPFSKVSLATKVREALDGRLTS